MLTPLDFPPLRRREVLWLAIALCSADLGGVRAQEPAVRYTIPGLDSIIASNDSVRVWGEFAYPRKVPGLNGQPSPLAGHCIDGTTGQIRRVAVSDPHGLTLGIGETFRLGGGMRDVWHDYRLLDITDEGPVFEHFRRVFDGWSVETFVLRAESAPRRGREAPIPPLRRDPLPEPSATPHVGTCGIG